MTNFQRSIMNATACSVAVAATMNGPAVKQLVAFAFRVDPPASPKPEEAGKLDAPRPGRLTPPKAPRVRVIRRIEALLASRFIQAPTMDHPELRPSTDHGLPWGAWYRAYRDDVLTYSVDWEGFTPTQVVDVIERVHRGDPPATWMAGLEATDRLEREVFELRRELEYRQFLEVYIDTEFAAARWPDPAERDRVLRSYFEWREERRFDSLGSGLKHFDLPAYREELLEHLGRRISLKTMARWAEGGRDILDEVIGWLKRTKEDK